MMSMNRSYPDIRDPKWAFHTNILDIYFNEFFVSHLVSFEMQMSIDSVSEKIAAGFCHNHLLQ